jgi:hypothetical protein
MRRKLTEALLITLLCVPLGAPAQDAAAPAAAEPAADASGATGTVVFFREKKFAGAAISYKVRENGIEICKLKSGTYCRVSAPVGRHSYEVHSEAKDVLTLEVESGETYYVLGAMSVGVFAGRPNLSPSTQVAYDAAKEKLKDNTGKDLDPPKEKK